MLVTRSFLDWLDHAPGDVILILLILILIVCISICGLFYSEFVLSGRLHRMEENDVNYRVFQKDCGKHNKSV